MPTPRRILIGMGQPPDEHDLAELTHRLRAARQTETTARTRLRDAVRHAHNTGTSKYRIQQLTGLARATIDAWTQETT